MKKLSLIFIIPLLFGAVLTGCIEEGDLPEQPQQQQQEVLPEDDTM